LRNELAHLRELVVVFLKRLAHLYDWREMPELSAQRGHLLGVLYRPGVGKLSLDLAGPFYGLGEAITKAQVPDVAVVAPPLAYF
jgi:hypothetical protein